MYKKRARMKATSWRKIMTSRTRFNSSEACQTTYLSGTGIPVPGLPQNVAPCRGAQHPIGRQHTHDPGQVRCDCSQKKEPLISHHSGQAQGKKDAPDLSVSSEESRKSASYRIKNMDCPMEEALIRKKLGTISGITGLHFNLMQRTLTVSHELPSTDDIERALREIDMIPEAVGEGDGTITSFSIPGMDCPVEERLVRDKLAGIPGVFDLECDLMQRKLEVRHSPSSLPAISAALDSLNMNASLLDGGSRSQTTLQAAMIPWRTLSFAGVLAALSEIFELIHKWGATPFGVGMEDWTFGGYPVLSCLSLLFAILAIILGGLTTYRKGWLAISNCNLNINALMSVAVTGAVLIGQYPEAAMVMVLFNLSEAIETKALNRTRNAIRKLLDLSPDTATVLQPDGSWREMDIRQVAVGSRVRVRPGEKIALDGVLLLGQSAVNQAAITGESLPVEKRTGDTVYAGTLNESGSFEFKVTAGASDSTLARIIHTVEEAQGPRAPIQRFVDVFARYYTPAVFVIAILAGILPPILLDETWRQSIYTALVILVIGCPCALVISTPVSVVSGMTAATRHGILVKGGVFLEQGRLLNRLVLDKTGTLTTGNPRQTDFIRMGELDEERIITYAASLASRSDHPVSRAIADHATGNGISPLAVETFSALPGEGVHGTICGQNWSLGNHRMMERLQACSPELKRRITELEQQGKTVVMLAGDAGVQGVFAVADTLRDTSVEAIRELKELGIKTMMLTGDNEHAAAAIAKQAGVDSYRGNLLPEDKFRLIEGLERTGNKVGMVGDGINDAPALAKAHIGFAMAKNGTDTAIETADVALMDDDLGKIPRFIRLSRSTHAILMQNIILAIAVKLLFFGLTFTGNASMWMAVLADVGTTLLVVINGLRALKK